MNDKFKMVPSDSKNPLDVIANTHVGQKITGAGSKTGDVICKVIDVVIDSVFKKR